MSFESTGAISDNGPPLGSKPDPGEFEALEVCFTQGRLADAGDLARSLTLRYPAHPAGWMAMGEALVRSGRASDAITPLQRAVELVPEDSDAHNDLGCALSATGLRAQAEEHFRRALALDSRHCAAHNNLGNALKARGEIEQTEFHYRRAIEACPAFANAHNGLAVLLQDSGRLAEAEASFRQALQLDPALQGAYHNFLFCLNFTDLDGSQRAQEARRYGSRVAAGVPEPFRSWLCEAQPTRLRVGLVSGDLGEHAVGHFLEGVLACLDRSRVEVFAYPTIERQDALAARIRPMFSAWTPIAGLDDEAAARRIHADGIHILCDLSGHTEFTRLPVFAWKPAPVQLAWLGHAGTTGIDAIDYILADPYTVPAGREAQFTERVWRLPQTRLCFTPPALDRPVAPLPGLARGHVTYCCFNSLSKIGEAVVASWAAILGRTRGSRLYLKARQLQYPAICRAVQKRFAAHGIGPERLILEGPSSRADYLASYDLADIALDPFPYTGATTSVEAMWMGVPVLTLAGDLLVARQGVGLLANAGLSRWIASDPDQYIELAVAHASDLAGLAALRSGLRPRVLASPIFDGAGFARRLDEALHEMWKTREPGSAG